MFRSIAAKVSWLLLGFCLACPAHSQQNDTSRINELEKKLEQSLKTIEQLTERVNQLETQRTPDRPAAAPASAATPAPVGEAEQRLSNVERKVTEIAESAGKSSEDRGIPLHGFADVGAGKAGIGAGANRANGFTFGALSLYLTPQVGDRIRTLIELVFEGNEGAVATDLERAQLGYAFSDAATLWLGRFHTPYGYWNTAYHHGAQIQTSILRPRFLDFEDKGGILPAHSMGLLLSGNVPTGGGRIVYDAFLANGSKIDGDVLNLNFTRDDNNNKAIGFNVGYRFGGGLRGLQLGLHGLTEEVDVYASGAQLNRSRLNLLGGYGYYEGHDLELISEYYYFKNKDLSGGTGSHGSWAGYAQAGYTLLSDWTPYLRLEKTKLDQNDNYFASQASGRSYTRYALGVRYELNPQSALKLELNRTKQPDLPGGDYSEALFQYSIRF